MANQKPLPALPSRPNLVGTLSVDARAHRSRLIRHFLSEIHDPGIQRRLDGWTFALEEALDELGQCIARGEWLPGIRRRKEAVYLARHNERLAERASKVSGIKKGQEASRDSRTQSPSEEKKPALNAISLAFPSLDDSHSQLENTLQRLRTHIARRHIPSSETQQYAILLCLASSGGQVQLPTEQHPSNGVLPSCTFFPGKYLLPSTTEHIETTVLYGLSEWDETLSPRMVGGTFSFKGIESSSQHELLAKVLRISIYVHLSLLLEQQFLSDSHVYIKFPRPRVHLSPSVPSKPSVEAPQPAKTRHRPPFSPSGLWSFLSRKTGLFNRAYTIDQSEGRSSLDLITSGSDLARDILWPPRSSADGGVSRHLRRLSFIGDRGSNPQKDSSEDKPVENDGPFTLTLKRIERSRSLLSTSVGVSFFPPSLIVDLATKENQSPKRRLKADERAALASILGWTGKDLAGKGMSGIDGFVRQQEISLLRARHVPLHVSIPANDASSQTTKLTRSSSSTTVSQTLFTTCCGRPKLVTHRYYSNDPQEDKPLGEVILDYFATANISCDQPGCTYKLGQHETRLVHNGFRISINVRNVPEDFQLQPSVPIDIWESCAVCNAETPKTKMANGTYLLSYGKFLELFIYSSSLCTLTPSLCDHTNPEPGPINRPPNSRLNLLRHFSMGSPVVTFSLSTIDNIFELRVPRLQMQQSISVTNGKGFASDSEHLHTADPEEDKRFLRREIKRWWEGISDHMDKLEHLLAGEPNPLLLKALPRLPSMDDAYDDIDTTPKLKLLTELPPIPPNTPAAVIPTRPMIPDISNGTGEEQKTPATTSFSETALQKDGTPTPSVLTKESSTDGQDSSELLASLRRSFQRTEHALYGQLSRTPTTALNDVRRAFLSSAKGAQKRLTAWQKKHFKNRPEVMKEIKLDLGLEEPEWWANGCHIIPGSNVIVREDDWGSIIAFALSSSDYHRELANLSMNRPPSNSHITTPSPAPSRTHSSGSLSFFTSGSGYKIFGSSANPQLDPDREDVIWHEPESYSAVVSRKEHPRDATSILSIREVLRQKSPGGGTVGSGLGPIDIMAGLPRSNSSEQVNLQSVYAKPDVGLSMQAADGQVSLGQVNTEMMGRILHGLETGSLIETTKPESSLLLMEVDKGASVTAGTPAVAKVENAEESNEAMIADPPVRTSSLYPDKFGTATSSLVETHIKRGKASSIISFGSEPNTSKEKQGDEHISTIAQPPIPPPKEFTNYEKDVQRNKMKELPTTPSNHGSTTPAPSSFANTITSTVHMAMRYMLNHPDPSAVAPPPKKLHNLLVDSNNIDEQPHIKYDWTIGKRLKFSCTVFYARQFDLMRKRCGINDMFLKSLSRSVNWEAVGGKSRSNFWKTADERFIIKTLVNAWNVADLQVLLELAPAYFRYMESTANKASVLAKLFGFYTIEIRNMETGAVQSKVDLLVMENLFYNRKISKTFDLKGIQGRKAKAKQDGTQVSRTLFDGEWLEDQQRALMLLRPHSKNVLREALRSDADFLAKSNIMDYSLLLGVDEENKQIACGLVDTIGSYTFAKTLEYKAKQNLQSGKDVTVIPPAEYQERFVNALEDYFITCPDKWSKPLDESKTISDPFLLPSAL